MHEPVQDKPIPVVVSMIHTHCVVCSVLFGMPEDLLRCRRKNGEKFFCPNGHGNYYVEGKAQEEAKLRARAEKAEADLADTQKKLKRLEALWNLQNYAPAPPATQPPLDIVRHRVLGHLKGVPKASHYRDIAKALGSNPGTVSAVCSRLTRDRRILRVGPGMYKIPPPA